MTSPAASLPSRRTEAAKLLRLAGPLILGQLAGKLMTFVDTVMAGRLSTEALAAVAAGDAMWSAVTLGVMGVSIAISTSVAFLDGARKRDQIAPLVRQALRIAVGLTLATWLLSFGAGPLLRTLDIKPVLIPTILGYVGALLWGIPAIFGFFALRFLCEGMSVSRPIMYFGFAGLVVNVIANYGLMYGHFGLPALGAVGCGYATSLVWWTQFVGLGIYIRRHGKLGKLGIFDNFEWPRIGPIRELLKLGLPIGFSFFVEVSMFAAIALLMGRISVEAAAGHQVAINVASTAFMLPLGLSLAITVRVGNAWGRGDTARMRFSGWVGVQTTLAVSLVTASILIFGAAALARIYTDSAAVIAIAVPLMILAGIFQFSDGLQVAASGALRGLKDTRAAMVITVIAYWAIGLPTGYWLCFSRGLGPEGLWYGIIGSLTIAGVLLAQRFRALTR